MFNVSKTLIRFGLAATLLAPAAALAQTTNGLDPNANGGTSGTEVDKNGAKSSQTIGASNATTAPDANTSPNSLPTNASGPNPGAQSGGKNDATGGMAPSSGGNTP